MWNEAYEENITMNTTVAENGQPCQSFAVCDTEEERYGIGIQKIDTENREEWICIKNDCRSSKDNSATNISYDNSRMCKHTCTVSKIAKEEGREEWSDQGMQTRMKQHQTIDSSTVGNDMLTIISPLEMRFNSLQEDYLYFVRNLSPLPKQVGCPRSLTLAGGGSSREKDSNHEKSHDYEAPAINVKTHKPRIGKPPRVPTTADGGARRCCRSAADVDGDHRALVARIEDENQSLKEILGDVLLRNQTQATTIDNMNNRLDELQTKLESRRCRTKTGKDHSRHSTRITNSKSRKPPARAAARCHHQQSVSL